MRPRIDRVRCLAAAAVMSGCGGTPAAPSSSGPGPSVDNCTATVTDSNALIIYGPNPSATFVPPACATQGYSYAFANDNAGPPPLENEPLPSGFPGAISEGGAGPESDDGSGLPQAGCIAGTTAMPENANAGMGFAPTSVFRPSNPGMPAQALLDASSFTGVEFWLWASDSTAASVSNSLLVQFFDKEESSWAGICDSLQTGPLICMPTGDDGSVCDSPQTTSPSACVPASAAVSGSPAYVANASGALLNSDGAPIDALSAGWQLIKVPWTSFLVNPSNGGANESSLDPKALTMLQFEVEQTAADASAGLAFDFCVYDIQFYH